MADPKKLNLVFRATNHIKLSLEAILREVFATDLVPESFRYESDEVQSKIRIFRGFPSRKEAYPCIAITAGRFDGSLIAMGTTGEEASEVFDTAGNILIAQTFTGQHTVPITLKVFSKNSSDEREQLLDLLYCILRIFTLNRLAPFGVAYNKIYINGEDQVEYADRELIFTNSVTIECHTDFTHVVDIAQSDLIQKIVIRVFGRIGNDPKAEKFFVET